MEKVNSNKEQRKMSKKAKIEESIEKTREIKKIANGAFYENGIIDQEQFETFLSNIPSGYTRIIRKAKKNWELFNEYKDNSEEELIEKEKSTDKKFKVLEIYKEMLHRGIMVDYSKMTNKTIDELKIMLNFVKDNPDKNFNRKNYIKQNPLRDIMIDTKSRDDYMKQYEDARWARIEAFENGLLVEKKIIGSVLQMKRVEREKNNQENITETEDENKSDLLKSEENLGDMPKLNVRTDKTKEVKPEKTETQQYSLDKLAEKIDFYQDKHTELVKKQQEIEQKIQEVLERKQTSIEIIGTEKGTAKEILQIIREQKKTLNELREELNKINSIDNDNRKIRDSLINELKSRILRGEE